MLKKDQILPKIQKLNFLTFGVDIKQIILYSIWYVSVFTSGTLFFVFIFFIV